MLAGTKPRRKSAEAIEQAALELFARRGYDDVTVAEIAAHAGVSRATFFRHYGSKEAVVFANHPRELDFLRAALRRRPQAGTDRRELMAAVVEWVTDAEARDDTLALRAQLVSSHPGLLGRALITRDEWARVVAEELTPGGGQPSLETQVLAASAMGAAYLAVKLWQDAGGRQPLHELLCTALALREPGPATIAARE